MSTVSTGSTPGTVNLDGISRQDAMRALLGGIAEDLVDYASLRELLRQQFEAAIKHRTTELGTVAEAISALVDTLQSRRQHRVALVQRLVGPSGAMPQAFALLKNAGRERMETDWKTLELSVLECKRLSKRNRDLMVEQYSIMQRVLHGEEQIYAPA